MSGLAARQLVIRLINTDGRIRDYDLPIDGHAVTEIVLKNGNVCLRPQNWLPEGESLNNIIAALYSSPRPRLFFEPRVEGCSVDPSYDCTYSFDEPDDFNFPASSEHEGYHFVCLRPEDTVTFQQHHCRFLFLVRCGMAPRQQSHHKAFAAPVAMATSDPDHLDGEILHDDGGNIQAKLPDRVLASDGDNEESETEDETEGERDLEASPQVAPTTGNTTVGTIAESPAARSGFKLLRLLSTADVNSYNLAAAVASSAQSPLAKKFNESQGDTQLNANRLFEGATHSDELGGVSEFMAPKPLPKLTYAGHSSRKGTPGSSRATPKRTAVFEDDADDVEDNIDVAMPVAAQRDDRMADADDGPEPEVPVTSDALDERGSAFEAARRSVDAGTKRTASDAAGPNEENEVELPAVPQKRRKTNLPKAAEPEDDPAPGKLKRPTKINAIASSSAIPQRSSKHASTMEFDDNITVAPSTARPGKSKATGTPSYPKVVVRSNDPSATPASTAGSTTAINGKLTSVLLGQSAVKSNTKAKQWLRSQHLRIIEDLPTKRANFICIVPGGKLGTTAKVLRSLALGKAVVTEDWVSDSMREGQLLDPPDYVHEDLQDTADVDRSTLFYGKTLFFTSAVASAYGGPGWESIVALCNEAGASRVAKGTAAKVLEIRDDSDLIIFGNERADNDGHRLMQEEGKTVYYKGFLTQSVLRGEVDLESDEFKMSVSAPGAKRKKR